MCGICGKYDIKERVERSLIEEMRASIGHRGPDDQGVYLWISITAIIKTMQFNTSP